MDPLLRHQASFSTMGENGACHGAGASEAGHPPSRQSRVKNYARSIQTFPNAVSYGVCSSGQRPWILRIGLSFDYFDKVYLG